MTKFARAQLLSGRKRRVLCPQPRQFRRPTKKDPLCLVIFGRENSCRRPVSSRLRVSTSRRKRATIVTTRLEENRFAPAEKENPLPFAFVFHPSPVLSPHLFEEASPFQPLSVNRPVFPCLPTPRYFISTFFQTLFPNLLVSSNNRGAESSSTLKFL